MSNKGAYLMQQGTSSGADSISSQLGVQRSLEWDKVRKAHLQISGQSSCAVCNGTEVLQVHHIIPFHLCHLVYRGDLELDERNLMTLCEVPQNNHHQLLGHLGDWEIYNQAGREGITGAFHGQPPGALTADQIQLADIWKQWMGSKPPRWHDMSTKDRLDLRKFLDTNLPYISTADFPQPPYPYLFMQNGDDGTDTSKIATTYGGESRWKLYLSQAAAAATEIAAQQH